MSDEHDDAGGQALRFPFIPLEKALSRASELHIKARASAIVVASLADVWGYAAKSSGLSQTISALRQYGLVKAVGQGTSRKVHLSQSALAYLVEERPERRAEALKAFALGPESLRRLWLLWGLHVPSDPIARSILQNDHGYRGDAAEALLEIYKSNVTFARLEPSDATAQAPQTPMFTAQTQGFGAGAAAPPPQALPEGIREIRIIDDEGQDIVVQFRGMPTRERYEFLRDYFEFLLTRTKPQPGAKAPVPPREPPSSGAEDENVKRDIFA